MAASARAASTCSALTAGRREGPRCQPASGGPSATSACGDSGRDALAVRAAALGGAGPRDLRPKKQGRPAASGGSRPRRGASPRGPRQAGQQAGSRGRKPTRGTRKAAAWPVACPARAARAAVGAGLAAAQKPAQHGPASRKVRRALFQILHFAKVAYSVLTYF